VSLFLSEGFLNNKLHLQSSRNPMYMLKETDVNDQNVFVLPQIQIKTLPTLALLLTLFNQLPIGYSSVHAETEPLTAIQLIKSDVAPKAEKLNDILFVLRTFDDLITKQDYTQLRSLLRQDPAVTLRTTARKLKLLLPSKQEQDIFGVAYDKMIDALDDMDTINLKRIQGDYDDKALRQALLKAIENYENMLKAIPEL